MDPRHSGISNGLRPPPETQPCAMSANYVLVLVNRLAGASIARSHRKPPAVTAIVRPYAAAWGVRPGQHRRERLGDLLVAGVVGMQTVGPTNQIPPNQAGHGLCRVKARSSGFAAQVNRSERPLTSRFVIPCCPLLSPRFRSVAAPARPTQTLNGPVGLQPGRRPRRSRELLTWNPSTASSWVAADQCPAVGTVPPHRHQA
jgi:hypothetical protein